MRVRIAVPASVANLGPGFDILAMALQLQNDVRAEQRPGTADHRRRVPMLRRSCNDPRSQPGDESPMRKSCEELGVAADGVHFTCVSRIPIGAGHGIERGRGARRRARRPPRCTRLRGTRTTCSSVSPNSRAIATTPPPRCSAASPSAPRAPRRSQHGGLRRAACRALHPRRRVHNCRVAPGRCPTAFSRADAIFNASRCALLVRALAIGRPRRTPRRHAGSLASGRTLRPHAGSRGRSSLRPTMPARRARHSPVRARRSSP